MRTSVRLILVPVFAGLLGAAALPQERTPGYTFTVEGEECEPYILSLQGDPDHPREGDVVLVQNVAMVLGPPGKYAYNKMEYKEGRLLLNGSLVAVAVRHTWVDRKKVFVNPLRDLKEKEIRDLRGIVLDAWNDEIAEKMKHFDPETTCLTVTDNTKQGDRAELPPLPADLVYLNIDQSSNRGIEDGAALVGQKSLKFFRFRSVGSGIDLDLLRNADQLRYLNLSGQDLSNTDRMRKMTEVRWLDLNWTKGVTNVDFAKSMPGLRWLGIARTKVGDLTPLTGLKKLEYVDANMSAVEKLPKGKMPALKVLKAMSASVSDEEAAGFSRANPGCLLMYDWSRSLADALKGVTRIRVRTGGTCHNDPSEEKTIFEVKRGSEIRKVIGMIEIDKANSGFHCMCCGEPSIEFYRKDKLVATLGVHHGKSLRWPDGWPGDAAMTEKSQAAINVWLEKGGAGGEKEKKEKEK